MVSKSDIKYVSSLQLRKFRQKYGQFVVEGEKCISELLISRYRIVRVYATEAWLQVWHRQVPQPTEVIVATEDELKKLSHHQTPPKVIAVAEILPEQGLPPLQGKLTLALDTIQDPGNLGTIIRIADWYGIENILCSPECADYLNPKCLSATMGSFTRVNIMYTNLESLISSGNVASYACVLDGESIYTLPALKEGIILIGNEGRGLSESLIHKATHRISIPRIGGAESLNAAVAAAIVCDNLAGRSISAI